MRRRATGLMCVGGGNMTEREKMLAGMLYDPQDVELRALHARARQVTDAFNQRVEIPLEARLEMLRALFGSTGERFFIEPSFRCDYGRNIYVGENFFMNFDCVILDVAPVHIGANCMIGPQVGIYTATHPLDARERATGLELGRPVAIGDDCWIGGHAVINPGVTLGDGVVVASGAVVTKIFGGHVVIGGNPARVLRSLAPEGQNGG